MSQLGDPRDPTTACVRCGKCLPACPLYRVDPVETLSPRGRAALAEGLLARTVRPTERAASLLYRCLLCGSCATACPRGTPTVALMAAGREVLAGRGHVNPFAKLAMTAASSAAVRGGLLGGMRAFRRILFARLPGESGLRLRFAGRMGIPAKVLPEIPRRSLVDEAGADAPPPGAGDAVAIFAGCLVNHLFPDIGRGTADAIRSAGMRPFVPSGQGCCGLMFWGEGETAAARDLAAANVRLLASLPVSRIVVPCASCLFALTQLYPELLADDRSLVETWGRVLPRLSSFSGFALSQRIPLAGASPELTVTWHDPCHLGTTGEPRELLRSMPGVTLREMEHPDRCCGSGGLFSVLNPKLSAAVGDAKADDILATGAQAVVTECPGCMLQIRESLSRKGSSIPVLHPAQLAAGNPGARS